MAWRVCQNPQCDIDGGRSFFAGVGKPPKYCPECRAKGFKVPVTTKAPKPRTIPSYAEAMAKVGTPEVVDSLPDDQGESDDQGEPWESYRAPTVDQGATGNDAGGLLERAIREIAQQSVSRDEIGRMIDNANGQILADIDSVLDTRLMDADKKLADKVTNIVATLGTRKVEIIERGEIKATFATTHKAMPDVLLNIQVGNFPFLVGPAGTGKSYLVAQCAEALGLQFAETGIGPTTPNMKLLGYMDANGRYVSTEFRRIYEEGGVFLLDEMDNGHPGLLVEINNALSAKQFAFADKMVDRHPEFHMVATGNTYGNGPDAKYVGRNVLDKSTLNRYTTVDIEPDEMMERSIGMSEASEANEDLVSKWIDYVQNVRRAVVNMDMEIVISVRDIFHGARLLNAGMEWRKVETQTMFGRVDSDSVGRIKARVSR